MKYLVRFTAIVALGALFTSCRKNYSCNCTYLQNGREAQFNEEIHGNQSHALHECGEIKAAQITNAGGTKVHCTVPI